MKERIKVLVVDDEENIAKGIALMVNNFGFSDLECRYTTDSSEVIDIIERENIDIVLTDVEMPEKNGLEILRQLGDLPVRAIVISGYDYFNYVRAAFAEGAVDYMLKPVDERELYESIARIYSLLRIGDFAAAARAFASGEVGARAQVLLVESAGKWENLFAAVRKYNSEILRYAFENSGRLGVITASNEAAETAEIILSVLNKEKISGCVLKGESGDPTMSLRSAMRNCFAFLQAESGVIDCAKIGGASDELARSVVEEKVAFARSVIEKIAKGLTGDERNFVEMDVRAERNFDGLKDYTAEKVVAASATGGALAQIDEIIDKNIYNNPDMALVSNALNQNYYYFSRKFYKLAGCSFSAYMERKKLEKARELLRDSDLYIKEIAEKLGYSTVQYLTIVFKRAYGITPRDYRSRLK